jgi:uncharacterized Zn finger protein (UPF0148 family)
MKRQCPCCGQKPKKKWAEERIAKWLEDARIDRLMVEKLEGLAKARKTEWMKAVNKLEGVADELERAASPTTGRVVKWDSVAPAEASAADVGRTLDEADKEEKRVQAERLEHQRAYNRAYYHKKKARIKQLRDARLAKKRAPWRDVRHVRAVASKRVGNLATKAATLQ